MKSMNHCEYRNCRQDKTLPGWTYCDKHRPKARTTKTDVMCHYKNCRQVLSLLSDGYCQRHDTILADALEPKMTYLDYFDTFVNRLPHSFPWKRN